MYAVITGASRGIGKALAYKFASHNYDLILTCENNIDFLTCVKEDIEKLYGKKVYVKQGLLDENLPDDIYLLINNAGKCDYGLFQNVTYERYKEITYANLDYCFLTTRLISKILLKNKQGIIANISSMWGIVGSSSESIYAMTKGGINTLTKSLAKEFLYSNIDVIAFALGAVNTDMNKNFINNEEFMSNLNGHKMYDTNEIAEKIYQIISYKKYKTGDIIEINNGLE